MAWEILTIKEIYKRGDELPKTPLVVVKEGEHPVTAVYLVEKILFGKDGGIIVNGAYIESNRREPLDQNTKVLHFCIRALK